MTKPQHPNAYNIPNNQGTIITASPKMKEIVYDKLPALASSEHNVLITGPIGTGKELLARAMHEAYQTKRGYKPTDLIIIDSGYFTETQQINLLYRTHKKGIITGAGNGSILFHEITDYASQISSLKHLLSNKEIYNPFAKEYQSCPNIKFIFTTSKNLGEEVAWGRFPRDMFYVIDTLRLDIPSLDERKEDILPLAQYFSERFCNKFGRSQVEISEEAKQDLEEHEWKGNALELEGVIETSLILMGSKTKMHPKDINFRTY